MNNQHQTQEELIEQFITEIQAHPVYPVFFKDYSKRSADMFVKLYATKKAIMTTSGEGFKTEMERMEMMWESEAMKRLEEIQQVKLFLFQCNYRAGAVQGPVEGVRTIFDFNYWKDNILNARFLQPVTEEDIELYTAYLMSPDVSHQPFVFIESWQDFEAIRTAYNTPEESDRDVPEWYQYYFSRRGHGIELSLPDIKSGKDIYYFQTGNNERIRLAQEAQQKAMVENPQSAPDKRAFFNEHADGNFSKFMHVFETKENRKMLEVWDAWNRFNERENMMRDDLDILLYAKDNVPVPESENWEDAIRVATDKYRSIKIAESLPAAYEQYKINLDLGITFPEHEDSRKDLDFYNGLVLLGRKLLGEPEDFNY